MKPSASQIKQINENFQRGSHALNTGAYDIAEKFFSNILKIQPDILEAHNALAFVYVKTKQHNKATQKLKYILGITPQNAQVHFNLANNLYDQKLYDEAISHYLTAIKNDVNFVDAYIHCGIAYHIIKDAEAAVKYLHNALNLDKKNSKAFHVLGNIYFELNDFPRALECLENAVGLSPNNPDYRISFANALNEAGFEYEAGIQYHLSCEVAPNYPKSFSTYSLYLQNNHRYDEAQECISRLAELAKLSSNNLDIYDQLGHNYLNMGNTDAAIDQFCKALKFSPERLPSLIGLEQSYQESGQLELATAACETIIKINPNEPIGYLLKSKISKSKQEDKLSDNLLSLLKRPDIDNETLINMHFALGKVFDDQRDYKLAFDHYFTGNSLKNKLLHYDREFEETSFSKLIEIFNKDFCNQIQESGSKNNFPILVVGMPRSGTTLTEQILSSHPSILGAGELTFWRNISKTISQRINNNSPYPECLKSIQPKLVENIAKMYEETLKKISGPNHNEIKHVVDKMPHNFINIGLISLFFPNLKIIHTKRDPIDTCLSIYFQNFEAKHDYAYNLNNLVHHYKQYQRMMKHWHSVLPGRIFDIEYSNTIADPEYWSRELISFIGLEWDDACLTPHKLERSVKTASHWQVRQPIYKTSVDRWKNYEAYIQPLINGLSTQ